jgi:DMSO reductase family type II enzyme heme b subunit
VREYGKPAGATAAFADAAAVMVPEEPTQGGFPSLQMGDRHSPARLFYWSAAHGAEELAASGRATTKPAGRTFPCAARHAQGKWTLVAALPEQPEGGPVAFALWDGETGDRDGRKWFSVWYTLTGPAGR